MVVLHYLEVTRERAKKPDWRSRGKYSHRTFFKLSSKSFSIGNLKRQNEECLSWLSSCTLKSEIWLTGSNYRPRAASFESSAESHFALPLFE